MTDSESVARHVVESAPNGRWPLRTDRFVAEFTLRSRTPVALRGRFPAASGELVVAPEPECSRLCVDLDVSGMRTDHPFTARRILRILNVGTYDVIRFQSTSVRLRGTDRLRIAGELEIGERNAEATLGARVLDPDPESLLVVGAASVLLDQRVTLALMLAADFGRVGVRAAAHLAEVAT